MSATGLPVLPDTGVIRADAARVAESGIRAKDHGQDLAATWAGLRDNYQAPEQDLVHGAMDKVVVYTDATAEVTGVIRGALDGFADAVDAVRPRHDALAAARDALSCQPPAEDEEGMADAEAEESRLARESWSIMADLQAAEDACAAAISGLHQSLWEVPGSTTSPYAAVGSGLLTNGLISVHSNPGPRLIRIALDPGSNTSTLNIEGAVTLRINGQVGPYFPRGSLLASVLVPLGPRTLVVHRPVFRDPEILGARRRTTANGAPVRAPQIPGWANKASNGLGVVDGVLAVYKNGSEQWNQDQMERPDYSLGQRVGSAAITAAAEGGGAILGSAAGTTIGASVGSLIPIPVVGTVVGAAVGGWVGGAVGEGAGYFFRNVKDKGAAEAASGAVKEVWENLKLW